jgi:hypothetical protein
MKKQEQSLIESLSKIKYMMNYDSSKTQLENNTINEQNNWMDSLKNKDWLDTLKNPGKAFQPEGGYKPLITKYDPTEVQDYEGCPNAIPLRQLEKAIFNVAHNVKLMNTALLRRYNDDERAQKIYKYIKSLQGKNAYNEDFGECNSAIELGKKLFIGEYRDWASKGETLESELMQLLKKPLYKNRELVVKYLNATLKLLEKSETEGEIEKPDDVATKPEDKISKTNTGTIAKPETNRSHLQVPPVPIKRIDPIKPVSHDNVKIEPKTKSSSLAPAPTSPSKKSVAKSEYKQEKTNDKYQGKVDKLDDKFQSVQKKWDDKAQAAKAKWDKKAQASKEKFQPKIDKLNAKSDYKQTKADAKVDYKRAKEQAKA